MPRAYSSRNPGSEGKARMDNNAIGRIIFWVVMLLFVGPMCGFFSGMLGPTIFPPLASLVAPLACPHGTLLAQPASASTSYSVVFRTRIWCVDSVTAVRNDISTPILYLSGLAFAVFLIIVLFLVMVLTESWRYLRARSMS